MQNKAILYSFRRCPYAIRARMSLKYSQQTVELREVVLADKPAQLLAVSPKGTVPVVVFNNGRVIEESLDIMLWALQKADPEDWCENLDAQLALISKNDHEFKPMLDKYKYADRFPEQPPAHYRSAGMVFLEILDQRLQKHRYLFADSRRLADVALFPFVRQFAHVDLAWFEACKLRHLKQWLLDFKHSELFTACMLKYPKWQSDTSGIDFP